MKIFSKITILTLALVSFAYYVGLASCGEVYVVDEYNFSVPTDRWWFIGSAYQSYEGVILTGPSVDQAGQMWLRKQFIGPFRIHFKYRAGGTFEDDDENLDAGGDGFMMMFYSEKDTTCHLGGALGYAGTGYAIEFDNFYNEGMDPSEHHIALIRNGAPNHVVYTIDQRTEDFEWHQVTVEYFNNQLVVEIDGFLVLAYQGELNNDFEHFGFAASTGDSNNYHIIDDVVTEFYQYPPYIVIENDFDGRINVNEDWSLIFAVEDPEHDLYTYELDSGNLPADRVYFEETDVPDTYNISWKPTGDDCGQHYFTILLEDEHGATSSETISVEVVSERVEILEPPDRYTCEGKEGELIEVRVAATTPGDEVEIYIKDRGGASGCELQGGDPGNPSHGVFRWTPREPGEYDVLIQATDAQLFDERRDDTAFDYVTIHFTIEENNPPIIISEVEQNFHVGYGPYTFEVYSYDEDIDQEGVRDRVIDMELLNAPSNCELTFIYSEEEQKGIGTIHWEPSENQIGEYDFIFVAEDEYGAVSEEYHLEVYVRPPHSIEFYEPKKRIWTADVFESVGFTVRAIGPKTILNIEIELTTNLQREKFVLVEEYEGGFLNPDKYIFIYIPEMSDIGSRQVLEFRAYSSGSDIRGDTLKVFISVGDLHERYLQFLTRTR